MATTTNFNEWLAENCVDEDYESIHAIYRAVQERHNFGDYTVISDKTGVYIKGPASTLVLVNEDAVAAFLKRVNTMKLVKLATNPKRLFIALKWHLWRLQDSLRSRSFVVPTPDRDSGSSNPQGSISIFAMNFWPGFQLGSDAVTSAFVNYLLRQAFGSFAVAPNEESADIVVSSAHVKKRPLHPERTICFIEDNIRPNYDFMAYSISSDFDSYDGRNCRVPYWYWQLQWPGFAVNTLQPAPNNHGFELPVNIDSLLRPRPPRTLSDSDLFCCFIAGNPEPHRMLAVKSLRAIGQVDIFGNIGKPLRESKYNILPRYRFNFCFENSAFPGYYTEKILHAWAGGCVPLYYSDGWYKADFNPKAIINRVDFRTLDEFANYVSQVNSSPSAYNQLYEQPLLTKRPSLDHVFEFLKQAGERIMQSTRKKTGV